MRRRLDADSFTHIGLFLLATVLLTLATIALGVSGVQYRTERVLPVAVADGAPDSPPDRLDFPIERQAAPSGTEVPRLVAILPQRDDALRWLRLSARLEGEISDVGPDPTRPPILATWFTRPSGERQAVSPESLETGRIDADRWEIVRRWPEQVTSVVATVLPRSSSVKIAMSELTVEILALTTAYLWLLGVLASAWAGLSLVAARFVWARFEGPAAIVPLALASVIGAAVMFSGDFIDSFVRPIVSLTHGTRAGVSLVATFKVGHAVAFALLTLSLLCMRRRLGVSAWYCIVLTGVLAVASEAAQLHLPARTAQLRDIGIDLLGIGAALLGWTSFRAMRARAGRDDDDRGPAVALSEDAATRARELESGRDDRPVARRY